MPNQVALPPLMAWGRGGPGRGHGQGAAAWGASLAMRARLSNRAVGGSGSEPHGGVPPFPRSAKAWTAWPCQAGGIRRRCSAPAQSTSSAAARCPRNARPRTPPPPRATHSDGANDRRARLCTHPEGRVVPVAEAQQLDGQRAGHAEHGPAAVDHLGLLEALQRGRVLGQAQGVEAEVAAEGEGRAGRGAAGSGQQSGQGSSARRGQPKASAARGWRCCCCSFAGGRCDAAAGTGRSDAARDCECSPPLRNPALPTRAGCRAATRGRRSRAASCRRAPGGGGRRRGRAGAGSCVGVRLQDLRNATHAADPRAHWIFYDPMRRLRPSWAVQRALTGGLHPGTGLRLLDLPDPGRHSIARCRFHGCAPARWRCERG
jgi:hypothetical protein